MAVGRSPVTMFYTHSSPLRHSPLWLCTRSSYWIVQLRYLHVDMWDATVPVSCQ